MTSARLWPCLFIGYFAIQAIIRIVTGPALELDEAEAFFFSDHLAFGYNAQPPLFYWLQWGMFQLFGQGIFAVAALKAALLSSILIALFQTLRNVTSVAVAGIAAASLSLLPQVVWEAQRALANSVLVLLMSVLLFACAWRVIERGRWRDHLLLGGVIGLGLLAKYNFAILPMGLFLFALSIADIRVRLRPGRLLVSLVLGLAMVVPYAVWWVTHADIAGGSVQKLGLATNSGPLMARLLGAAAFAAGLAAFLALAIVVLTPFTMLRDKAIRFHVSPFLRFLGMGAVFSLTLLLIMTVASGATEVKDRWLLPLAWPLVPFAVVTLWPTLLASQQRILSGIILGLWLLAMVLLPYATLRNPGYRAADFVAVMGEVHALAPETDTVMSNRTWLLGNLAFLDPAPVLVTPEQAPDGAFVIVVDAGRTEALLDDLDLHARASETVAYSIQRGDLSEAIEITPIAAN